MRRVGALIVMLAMPLAAAGPAVTTILGTGAPGYTDTAVNNPYGLVVGPDQCLYFCDLDNQRIRRFDPKTKRVTTIAGNGERGYSGDGGPATAAALNMPHEIQFDAAGNLFMVERDSHVVRKVDMKSGIISTIAGTGTALSDTPWPPSSRRGCGRTRRWRVRGRPSSAAGRSPTRGSSTSAPSR